jgi:hypothetical protein
MSTKKTPTTKEERLAKALRENLARRKALVRAKRERAGADQAAPGARAEGGPARDKAPS